MASAIKLDGAKDITLRNVHIEGFDVGIEANNASINAEGVTFKDVGQAWKVDGSSQAAIRGGRVTQSSKEMLQNTPTSKGWRASSAPALPILCNDCGAISPSHHHQFRGLFFDLWDNEEPCPKCGGIARLSEGAFNLSRETIEILKAPDVTRAMIQDLLQTGDDYLKGQIDAKQAIEEVEKFSPNLSKAVRLAVRGGITLVVGLTAVFTLANQYYEFVSNTGIDPVRVSADFIMDHLPATDTPPLNERIESDLPEQDHREGANPAKGKPVR